MITSSHWIKRPARKSGEPRWTTRANADAASFQRWLFLKDKVLVGNAGGDGLPRLSNRPGSQHRPSGPRFYTPGREGHATGKSDSWKFGGGELETGSFDPQLNLVYWGVRNAAGDASAGDRYAGERPEGANVFRRA
jgi:alcohol dehydrogenase (cytochrome c)